MTWLVVYFRTRARDQLLERAAPTVPEDGRAAVATEIDLKSLRKTPCDSFAEAVQI